MNEVKRKEVYLKASVLWGKKNCYLVQLFHIVNLKAICTL